MVVPYRDPTNDHKARTAFDIGEWGLGFMTTSLDARLRLPRRDRLPGRRGPRLAGRAADDPNAICIHEEDDAILWKHVDPSWPAPRCGARAGSWSPSTPPSPTTSTSSTGASTRTATSSARCGRPGIMVTTQLPRGRAAAVRDAGRRAHLRAVPPALHRRAARPRHRRRAQHGPHDRVRGAARSGPDNPDGLALVQRSVPLRTEQEGMQDYDWHTQRAWKVVNEAPDERARHAGRLQARARPAASPR